MSDIQELFSRDPLSLTDQDLDALIDAYRKARHLFDAGQKSAGSAKKMAEPKPTVKKSALDLSALLAKK